MGKLKLRAQLEIVEYGEASGRWRRELPNLSAVRTLLGDELLTAFVRCFVHSDRLTSLAHFGRLHGDHSVPEPAASRNYFTSIWLTVGILRELGTALRGLRSALKNKGWLDLAPEELAKLQAVESRWLDNTVAREVRNQQAFHVDSECILRGLDAVAKKRSRIILVEGSSSSDYETRLTFGAEILVAGTRASETAMQQLVKEAFDDTKIYLVIDRVFLLALQKCGVKLRKRPWRPRRNAAAK